MASTFSTLSSSSNNNNNHEDSAFHEEEPVYTDPADQKFDCIDDLNQSFNQNLSTHLGTKRNNYDFGENDFLKVFGHRFSYRQSSSSPLKPQRDLKDLSTRQKIMQSLVYCIHKDDGCTWQGSLFELKGHFNACQKDAVACLNLCGAKIARAMMEDHMLTTCSKRLVRCLFCRKEFTGAEIDTHRPSCGFEPVYCENKCGQKIQRNRIKAHRANTCSKRLVACAYCKRSFTAETLQTHHLKCALFPVPCPNRCSKKCLAREDVSNHLALDCCRANDEDLLVTCAYADSGCEYRGNKSSMELHECKSVQHHLVLATRLNHRQAALIRKLTVQLEQAKTSYNGVLVWKIKEFALRISEARSSEGLELISLPFFTSQNGYKLQASLFLNGNGEGEGSHMSVYIKILPGEFDSILKWPFKHTVSFTLIDQNYDRSSAVNVVECFLPDPTWPNFQQPSKEPHQLGFGFPKFVSHLMLSERDYVKDDAIFLKIRIDQNRNIAV